MYKLSTLIKIFTLCGVFIIALCNAQTTKPLKTTMKATIFDQHKFYNPNFQPPSGTKGYGSSKGMVKSSLNTATRLPDLSDNVDVVKSYIPWKEGFKYFFTPMSELSANVSKNGKNFPIAYEIELSLNSETDYYYFDSSSFFPINDQGFNSVDYPIPQDKNVDSWRNENSNKKGTNYNFCLKLNTRFQYNGDEVFKFRGDDDVWVFINNYLVVDIGGIHSAEAVNIDLSKITNPIKLVKGDTYNFDFFYCERNIVESNIRIETNIYNYCAYVDYCGVCEGDGSTCCRPSVECNDGKRCTTDSCPDPKLKITKDQIAANCIHTPYVCPIKDDACSTYKCTEGTGAPSCGATVKQCPGNPNNCEDVGSCDVSKGGCVNLSKCNKGTIGCQTGKCNAGVCESISDEQCGSTICKPATCQVGVGCQTKSLCPASDKTCIITTCNPENPIGSRCVNTTIKDSCDCCTGPAPKCKINFCTPTGNCEPKDVDVDDNNECTIDACDPATGDITHTPKDICSGCKVCDIKTGGCVSDELKCNDNNVCTNDACVLQGTINGKTHGECNNNATDCGATDTNKCNIWTCDSEKGGCQSTQTVCEDKGQCLVGQCVPSTGQCIFVDRKCYDGDAFCIISECDERLGCLVYDKRCSPDNSKCQTGVCYNATDDEEGYCGSEDYDPLPFACKTAAVVSTAVIAGVTVAGAVALGAFIYGGKKGYDYWKDSSNQSMRASNSNPLYEESTTGRGVNPLYGDNGIN